MNMKSFPLSLPALKVSQPLGDFWAVSIPADVLRAVTFLDPTRITKVDTRRFVYRIMGSQRESSLSRAKSIAKYIDTVEAAFPNSIILAANYIDGGDFQVDASKRWRLESKGSGTRLIIPTMDKMASVIDGQHRLLGFDYCLPQRKDMDLLCSVYMDLPQTFQAYLFATININQRKVDKSLAYEQFGYNLEEEGQQGWAPDRAAVFLTRRLNLDPDSPLHLRVKIAPLEADLVIPSGSSQSWVISTACVVEGIISLISSTPKQDRNRLHLVPAPKRSRNSLATDKAPFRSLYLASSDDAIYTFLKQYFIVCRDQLWSKARPDSYIIKTIGIQAQFDILRAIAPTPTQPADLLTKASAVLTAATRVNFSDGFFQASGKGRVRVKNTLLFAGGVIAEADLPEGDRSEYLRVCGEAGVRSSGG